MKNSAVFKKSYGVILAVTTALAGCIGGGGSSASSSPPPVVDTPPSVATLDLTGTVNAPGGAVAFNAPTGLKRMFAEIVGKTAAASISGTLPVGADVTVNLIEINAAGAQVGAVIATGTTNSSGAYTIKAPSTFVPAANYVVRAVGTSSNIDAIVTDTTVDVDPSTETTKELVLASAQAASATLASLSVTEISEIQNQIEGLVHEADTSAATTAASFVTAIKDESGNNEELSNIVSSIAQSGVISGKVTGATGTGLANIKVVARDHNNWVTRAQTRTDTGGNYTLHVPVSATQGYIVGAFNYTSSSMGASEFYDGGSGATAPLGAARVTVASGTPSLVDFQLEDGARITGSVTTDTGTALPGIRVQLRDVDTGFPTGATRSRADGSYTINVRAGTSARYTLLATNMTLQPYGGSSYNGPASGGDMTGGGAYINDGGAIINPGAGQTVTANLKLAAGHMIGGKVTVGPSITDTPVPGISVRLYSDVADGTNGGFVDAVRTNLQGKYRMWLKPGLYKVRSRGQARAIDLSASNDLAGFFATVGSAKFTVTSNGATPVSQVKVQTYDSSQATPGEGYLNFEPTNGDGTVTVYSNAPTTTKFVFLVDGGQAGVGSVVYDGTATPVATAYGVGSTVDISSNPDLGPITLPAGATLSGTLTGGANGTRVLQIRSGGFAAANVFVNSRSQVDGTYSINLPAGTYNVRNCDPTPLLTTTGYCGASNGTFNFTSYPMGASNTSHDFP